MKQIKYFVMALFAVLAMASCDTDLEGPIYTPTVENISMAQETQSYTTNDTQIDIPVHFLRANKKGEYTVHYTLESTKPGVFSDTNNGAVTFADGEADKTVVFHASNLEAGVKYQATVTLSDADVEQADTITNSANFSTTIVVMREYLWEDAGTAKFTDFTHAEDEELGATVEGVKVEHAITNDVNLYRLVAPYNALYGDISKANIQFYLDADGNAQTLGPAGIYDIFKETGYAMYWDPVKYASNCVFSNNGNKFHVEFLLAQPSTGKLFLGGLFEFEWNR